MFAVLAQELGFIGALVVFLLTARCCGGSSRARGRRAIRSGCCSATGLASMLLFQLFVNMGMVIGLMPVTGIPLPFITQRWRVAR